MNILKLLFSRAFGYTKIIAFMLMITISLIPRDKKKFAKYWIAMFLTGVAWTLLVNNMYPEQAWSFTKINVLNIYFFNIALEDYIFYMCSPVLFFALYNVLPKPKEDTFVIPSLFTMFTIFSYVDCMISLTITMFFMLPGFYFFIRNKLKFNYWAFLLLVPSTLWDWANQWYFHHWTYNPQYYGVMLFNVPVAIAPYFTISGIVFSYSVYVWIYHEQTNSI